MDITVFLGAPGSGKGTQAKILAKQHGFRHLSTGDMLRAAIQAGSGIGLKAKKFLDAGELVPDATMIELIEKTLSELSPASKIILDGFPRTVAQAEALNRSSATAVARAIYLAMPMDLLARRLTGRRICSQCGQPYHIDFLPSEKSGVCDLCGGALQQRPDDTEAVVQRRLQVFIQQTQPLLDFFKDEGKLVELDGNQEVDALQATLVGALA